jgi:hypothetical protein
MATQRNLLPQIVPAQWDSGKPSPGSGFERVRHLQSIDDLVNRPVLNRGTATTSATAVNANGAVQSTGIGTIQLQPMRYAEFTVKARVTFNINSAGPASVSVYRTSGAIPAAGAAPNVGDVVVGGDSFVGGPTSPGVNQSGSFSFLDTDLSVNAKYRYYFAIQAPNGTVMNLVNNSQLLVMERS